MRAWTLLVIKTRQLVSERESQSAMIICRVYARRFFQFPVMFTNNKKWRSTSWLTMFNSLFSFPTFLLFSPFRLVRSNTWVQWKHLTPERSIDLYLQTFPKLLLLLVPKVTTCSLYPGFTSVTNKGEHSIFSQSKQTLAHRKGWKKSPTPWKVQ